MIKYQRNPVKDYLAGVAGTIFASNWHEMAQPLQQLYNHLEFY